MKLKKGIRVWERDLILSIYNIYYKYFYFTIQVWSSIVIVHKKSVFFFQNISKTAETILIKKIGRKHGISVYKKSLISENRKIYIFRDNNCFVKMSVSLSVS